jgi:hypothetical protein
VDDELKLNAEDDPFDVASGDMDAVARRVEKFFDAGEDQTWLERAQADIARGRTAPVDVAGLEDDSG